MLFKLRGCYAEFLGVFFPFLSIFWSFNKLFRVILLISVSGNYFATEENTITLLRVLNQRLASAIIMAPEVL